MDLMLLHALGVFTALDPVPTDNNVKAGWVALGMFILAIVAVVFLCLSLRKQLRKIEANREAGVFDESPAPKGPKA